MAIKQVALAVYDMTLYFVKLNNYYYLDFIGRSVRSIYNIDMIILL